MVILVNLLVVHCKYIKFVLNHGMVISVASSLVFTVVSLWCVAITIIGGQYSQKQKRCSNSTNILLVANSNYGDTHYGF